jgi:hypothetical protein
MDTEADDAPWSAFEYPPTCFEPHIIALTRDQVLYPFVEINCPRPVMDTSVLVQERPYYPYADLDVHYNISHTECHIMVNLHDRKIVNFCEEILAGLCAVWTVLAPQNAPDSLVFPEHI